MVLRNWGTVEFRNNSEITPKLGTVELWNYSEITPKLGTGIVTVELRNYGPGLWYCEIEDRGTMELLRSYTEITPKLLRNYSEVIPKSLRNYSETMGLGLWPWNYGITPKLYRNYYEITPKLTTVELWNYSEVIVACYSPLLVLVCWSVSQDPPRPIEDITVAFGLLYSPSTALSQSAVSYAHAAPGRPISDRLSPDTAVLSAVLSFALRKYFLN